MRTALAVTAVLAAITVWIDLGRYHGFHNADDIVPVLNSLYRWTFFYWEDDRFGMVLPLLALPVRHPFWNLMVQCGMAIFAGLASFFAVARCVSRDYWVPLGAVAALLYLGGYGAERGGMFTTGYTYGPATALAGAGLVLLLPRAGKAAWWDAAGTALIFAAHWAAVTVAFVLGPLVLGRSWFGLDGNPRPAQPPEHTGWTSRVLFSPTSARLAIVAAAFLTSDVATKMSAYYVPGRYSPLPLLEWAQNWAGIARNTVRDLPWTLTLAGPVIAALGLTFGLLRRDHAALRTALGTALTLAAGGIISFLLTGVITWTKLQDRNARYAIPAVFLLDLALLALGLIPCLAACRERGRRIAGAASLAALVGVGVARSGLPSLQRVRADLDRTLGTRTAEILDRGVTHFTGSYWNVWPSVYHANLVLHERHSDRTVWGVTHRASPAMANWTRMPLHEMRIAAATGDDEAAKWLEVYRLPPMAVSERLATIDLYDPVPESTPAQAP